MAELDIDEETKLLLQTIINLCEQTGLGVVELTLEMKGNVFYDKEKKLGGDDNTWVRYSYARGVAVFMLCNGFIIELIVGLLF